MLPGNLQQIIHEQIELENSAKFQTRARYRNAVHSRIYARLRTTFDDEGIDLEFLGAAAKQEMVKVSNVQATNPKA